MVEQRPVQRNRGVSRRLSKNDYARWRPLLEIARNVGVGVTGTRGVGKSTLLFLFCWLDAIIYDKPMIAILPTRNVFDLFVTQVSLLARPTQREIWDRVRYVPMSGFPLHPGDPVPDWRVVPTGLYYASGLGGEDAFEISQRFPEALLKLEPQLAEASVQGYKAIWKAATQAGRILYTLDLGITHMADFLTQNDTPYWQQRMTDALQKDPGLIDAVVFFRTEYAKWSPGRRDERINSLMTRLSMFASPIMQAQFGPAYWGFPWKDVFEQKLKVFIDISYPEPQSSRAFKMLFVFFSLYDAIKRYRSITTGTRNNPISLIIDEIAVMLGGKNSPMAGDFDEFVNTYSRNFNIHFVASFQEPYQIEEPKILETMMSLGTKFYARMTSPNSSRLAADRCFPYDPFALKEIQWHHVGGARDGWYEPKNIYYTRQEQIENNRQRFEQLPRGQFLVQRTTTEGDTPLGTGPFSLSNYQIRYPDDQCVRRAQQGLMIRDGKKVKDVRDQLRRHGSADRPAHSNGSGDLLQPPLDDDDSMPETDL